LCGEINESQTFLTIATELPYTTLTALTAWAEERIFSRNCVKLLRRYGRYVRYVRVETRRINIKYILEAIG